MATDEERALREQSRAASKAVSEASKVLQNISQNSIDKAEYRVGGAKEHKFTVTTQNSADTSKIKINEGTNALTNAQTDNTQSGAYNKRKVDMTSVANATLEASKKSYRDTDFSSGTYQIKRYGALVGLGSISRHVAISDVASKLHNRDISEVAGVQNVINNWTMTKGSKATYKTFSTDASHSKIVDEFGNNQRLVDAYLQGHGINTRNMTTRDIDRMLGKSGKYAYGNSSFIFKGAVRDKVSSVSDSFQGRNTRWAGKSKNGVQIDSEMRDILLEKRFMLEMSPKIKQIQNASGGLKNTATVWVSQGTEETDTTHGYQYAQGMVHGIRAGAMVSEGLTAGVGQATVRSIEATGRIASSTAKGTINLGGKIYAHGDAVRASKWATNFSKVNIKLDKMNAISKTIGQEGSRYIGKSLKASVGFTGATTFQKAKIIKNNVSRGGKWAVKSIVGKEKYEKLQLKKQTKRENSKYTQIKKAISRKVTTLQNFKYNPMKAIKLPFTAINAAKRMIQKLMLKTAIGFVILCLMVVVTLAPILLIPSIIPGIFLADDSAAITKNVGDEAIKTMLEVQSNFLNEVSAYYDATCTLEDEDGNKLHPHHYAYFASYFGSNNNEYEDLISNQKIISGQSVMILYKTIISMATAATGNESEDAAFYTAYCTSNLEKILHNSTCRDVDGVIAVSINDSSLVDGMKLDAKDCICGLTSGGCGAYFPKVDDAWMHNYGDDSLEYSTWLRSSKNYNEWKGWITDDQGNFDWAKSLYDMDPEDWAELNIELPNPDGGGTGVAISEENVATILDGVAGQLSDSDSSKRMDVIKQALYENNRMHVYSWGGGHQSFNKGDDLPVGLDCSGFVFGVLQTAGVASGPGSTATAAGFPDAATLRPGDIILKYHNDNGNDHIILYLGETQYGAFTTIECTTRISNITNTKISGVQMNAYNSLSDFQNRRGYLYDKFKNPYGD